MNHTVAVVGSWAGALISICIIIGYFRKLLNRLVVFIEFARNADIRLVTIEKNQEVLKRTLDAHVEQHKDMS